MKLETRHWAFAAAVASLFSVSAVRADQLIQIPTADRAAGPTVEYNQRVSGHSEGYASAVVPVGLAYELMFRYYNNEDHEYRVEGGAQFQLLPDGVITPAVSLGLWDVTNSSPWGRRGFLVLTKSLRPGQLGIPKPLERVQLTLGTGTGRFSGILAGARVDLPAHFSLVSEYDSRRLNAGLWFSPAKFATLKGELHNGNPYVGGQLQAHF